MINEFVYCPRLFHLMHVDGRWAENGFTLDGKNVHRRVDRKDEVLPEPRAGEAEARLEEDDAPSIRRSVTLSSADLGVIGKLDLVSTSRDEAIPVETKRGRVPDNPERSWPPERVQLMLQGLLLREHGFRVSHGILYFAASRTRVEIPFDEALEQSAREAAKSAREASTATDLPLPLEESPKCHGCSLHAICLPDETHMLREPNGRAADRVRKFVPTRFDSTPLYVQEQGATLGKAGRELVVRKKGEVLAAARLIDVSQVVLCGNVTISAQAIKLLAAGGIPVLHVSTGHWFSAMTQGFGLRNAFDRAAQFRVAADPEASLDLAKTFVLAKARNQRTVLRRNGQADGDSLQHIRWTLRKVAGARSLPELLGYEGTIARAYFQNFSSMLSPKALSLDGAWDFDARNRRPPRDPVNALLSYCYAMLVKDCTVALVAEGLDPWWGFFHRPRHGRPALALDLMEEFRPTIADSAVITAVNTGMVADRGFIQGGNGCAMQPSARKAILRAYEARLDQLVTHPVFGYRASWRSIVRLQARVLSRVLRGDLSEYTGMTTR